MSDELEKFRNFLNNEEKRIVALDERKKELGEVLKTNKIQIELNVKNINSIKEDNIIILKKIESTQIEVNRDYENVDVDKSVETSKRIENNKRIIEDNKNIVNENKKNIENLLKRNKELKENNTSINLDIQNILIETNSVKQNIKNLNAKINSITVKKVDNPTVTVKNVSNTNIPIKREKIPAQNEEEIKKIFEDKDKDILFEINLVVDRMLFCKLYVLDVLHDFYKKKDSVSVKSDTVYYKIICELIEDYYKIFYGPVKQTAIILKEIVDVKNYFKNICNNNKLDCAKNEICEIKSFENVFNVKSDNLPIKLKPEYYYDTGCDGLSIDNIMSPVQYWEFHSLSKKSYLERRKINNANKNSKIFINPLSIKIYSDFNGDHKSFFHLKFMTEERIGGLFNEHGCYLSIDTDITGNDYKNLSILKSFFGEKVVYKVSFYDSLKKFKIALENVTKYYDCSEKVKNALDYMRRKILFVKFCKDFLHICSAKFLSEKIKFENDRIKNEKDKKELVIYSKDMLFRTIAFNIFKLRVKEC